LGFLYHLSNATSARRITIRATPPTTPPIIAPFLLELPAR